MAISDVLDNLVLLVEGLTITDPQGMDVKKVYRYAVNDNDSISDTPAFILETAFDSESKHVGFHDLRYTTSVQMLYRSADQDYGIRVCEKFHEAFWVRWRLHTLLNNTVEAINFTGAGGPAFGRVTRNNLPYSAWQFQMSYTIKDVTDFTDGEF